MAARVQAPPMTSMLPVHHLAKFHTIDIDEFGVRHASSPPSYAQESRAKRKPMEAKHTRPARHPAMSAIPPAMAAPPPPQPGAMVCTAAVVVRSVNTKAKDLLDEPTCLPVQLLHEAERLLEQGKLGSYVALGCKTSDGTIYAKASVIRSTDLGEDNKPLIKMQKKGPRLAENKPWAGATQQTRPASAWFGLT